MSAEDGADYPQLFRQMIVRGAQAALASIDPQAPTLAAEACDRSLHALTLALKLPEAWPSTNELMLTVSPYLRWQGDSTAWMAFLEAGIAAAERQGDVGALAKLHHQLSRFCRVFSRLEQAEQHATRACQLAVQQDDTATRIDALYELMVTAETRADFAAVQSYVDELFALTDAEDPRRAFPYSLLGHVAARQDDHESSIHWYRESLRLHTVAGQFRLAAQAEQGLAWVHLYCGQNEQALVHFQHALETMELHTSLLGAANVRIDLAYCRMLLGDYAQALEMCRLSEPVFINLGDKKRLSVCYNHYGMIYARMDRYQEAERLLLRSVELARELHLAFDAANALESLGTVYRELGDSGRALAAWEEGLEELGAFAEPPQRLYNLLRRRIQEVKRTQGNLAPSSPEFQSD